MTLITGASSGIGAQLARQLALRGKRLALVGRHQERLNQVAHETGGSPYVADLAQLETIASLMAKIDADLGGVRELYLNAGIGETQEMPFNVAEVDQIFRVNLLANIHILGALLPAMIQRQQGHIIAISSLAADRGFPRSAAYGASKAGLNIFLEGIRVDLRRSCPAIVVTVISPGFIKTPLTDRNTHKMPFLLDLDEAVDRILRAVDRKALTYRFPWPAAFGSRLMSLIPTSIYTHFAARVDRPPKRKAQHQ
jgi:short-subunit dehydrogenase